MTLAAGAAVTAVCFGAALGVGLYARHAASSPQQLQFSAASEDVPADLSEGCRAQFFDLRPPNDCVWGEPDGERTVALMGDSHAGAWLPALDELAKERDVRLVEFIKSACPYAELELFNAQIGRTYTECTEWRTWAIDQIIAMDPELVVLSSARDYVERPGSDVGVSPDEYRTGLVATLGRFDAAGIPVLLIADVPNPGFDVPGCLSRRDGALVSTGDCTFDRAGVENRAAIEAEQRAAELAGVTLVDLSAEVCPQPRCRVFRDDMVLFSDSNHMTARFNATLAVPLDEALERAGLLAP